MALIHIYPLTLLLLHMPSSLQAGSCRFSCVSYNAERGKNTNITCKNSQDFKHVTVTFCSYSGDICSNTSEINTYKGKYTFDDGRISLRMSSSAILTISDVQIRDQRKYRFFLSTYNDHSNCDLTLNVFAPYSLPQVTRKNDTLICTATGGYPKRHLYWFDNHRTNLTARSKFVALQNADSSFFLNSTLWVDSAVSEVTYCCTLRNENSINEHQDSSCITFENVITNQVKSEKTRNFILAPVISLLSIMLGLLLLLVWRSKTRGMSKRRRKEFHTSDQRSTSNLICDEINSPIIPLD